MGTGGSYVVRGGLFDNTASEVHKMVQGLVLLLRHSGNGEGSQSSKQIQHSVIAEQNTSSLLPDKLSAWEYIHKQ